ncbi:hypothetical protein BC940DRAFT_315204 [Gongronella butleri]|nr:hypothetical protein BC940DRAFT_315204 [Gongronella butleri]
MTPNVGIDMYTSGLAPSMLIRDHLDDQPLSSLFPKDEDLMSSALQQSTIGSFSSHTSSSLVSTASDLFSTLSVETPTSTLSSIVSHDPKRLRQLHVPGFGDEGGLSTTMVAPTNESHQFHVAQRSIQEGLQLGHAHLLAKGVQALADLAHGHCIDAYYPLAECYYLGLHVPNRQPDMAMALHWFNQVIAAIEKEPMDAATQPTLGWAQYRVAKILESNHDDDAALHHYTLSAENNNMCAQFILGLHQQYRQQDIKQAIRWYEPSARQGYADAQIALGELILQHHHVLVDSPVDKQRLVSTAIDWMHQAARQGNAKAHLYLGVLYDEGEWVARDAKLAMQHYQAAVSMHGQGNHDALEILAQYFVGIHYLLGDLVAQNASTAYRHLHVAALGQYAPAQRALGLMFLEGTGVPKDGDKAFEWFTKAAMQGDVQSLGLLGEQAEKRGYDVDMASAIEMYTTAAQSGSVTAQLSLANLLLRTDRRDEAFPWFKRASEAQQGAAMVGHMRQRHLARLMVARYVFNGWSGVPMDRLHALQEFVALSDVEQLNEAHYWVGACYEEGIFRVDTDKTPLVAPDADKAFYYYHKGAIGGDVDAQFQVALMLANGATSDKKKNKEDAFQWYQKAAQRGHPTAQYSLGLFYERGLAPVDKIQLEKAMMWYRRAGQQQHTSAMINLAQLLLRNDLGDTAHQEALDWLHIACGKPATDKNHTRALLSLAAVFEQGNIAMVQADPDRYDKAWQLLQKAKDNGDPMALVEMARYHENGLGRPQNVSLALQLLLRAEQLGYKKAHMDIAELYHRHKLYKKAMDAYKDVINANPLLSKHGWNARLAVAKLVLLDETDVNGEEWHAHIFQWLSGMAQQSVGAINMDTFELLGICYEQGKGTNADLSRAIECYDQATKYTLEGDAHVVQERARVRLVEACMQLGRHAVAWDHLQVMTTHFGHMNKTNADTRRWGRTARFYLGYLCLHGDHMTRDETQARQWLSQAADEGDGNACLELARLDLDQAHVAKQRLEQGISSGHAGCMIQLALMLEQSESEADEDAIMELLERAVELGHADARFHMARRLHLLAHLAHLSPQAQNHDVRAAIQANYDKATQWYNDAIVHDNRHARAMVGLGFLMLHLCDDEQKAISLWQQADRQGGDTLANLLTAVHALPPSPSESDITRLGQQLDAYPMQHSDLLEKHILGHIACQLGNHSNKGDEKWYKLAVALCNQKDAMYQLGMLCKEAQQDAQAVEWFRQAAEQFNHGDAQYQMGCYHATGSGGLDVNLVAAQRYLKLAVENGVALAKDALGKIMLQQGLDLWRQQGDYARALKQLEAAAQYESQALVELGHLYHTGFSSDDGSDNGGVCVILRNYREAFTCYFAAAERGNAMAALMIGSYYEDGYLHDVEDHQQALAWYEKAHHWQCGPLAELAIGNLKFAMAEKKLASTASSPASSVARLPLDEQLEIRASQANDLYAEAYTWLESAVAAFFGQDEAASAKVLLALYHLKGLGNVPRDAQKGFDMLTKCVHDHPHSATALSELAACYDQGIGVQKDMVRALEYWEKAAALDDLQALRRAANIYQLGLANGHVDTAMATMLRDRADALACRHPARVLHASTLVA